MNDAYVVYVNHPRSKAIIHTATCGRFVYRRRDSTFNGYWSIIEHEPFKSLKDAQAWAKKTGKKNIDTCAFCVKY